MYFTSSGLFYPCFIIPNHKIVRKIDYFNPNFVETLVCKNRNKIHIFPFCFANSHKIGCLNLTVGGYKTKQIEMDYFIPIFEERFSMTQTAKQT